jgi:hypothetical protein
MIRRQKTLLILLGALSLAVRPSYATLPVVDYSHIAQDAGNEVVNFAKWAKTEVDQAQTEINTLKTYENTVLQVARMGNPAALRAIPGVSTVAELATIGQQIQNDYLAWRNYADPQYYRATFNSILSTYKQPTWNGFAGLAGQIAPSQTAYQFPVSSWNIASHASQELAKLEAQRKDLETQRNEALRGLQSATTASDVAKYQGALDGLNGALASISGRETALHNQTVYNNQQVQAAQQVSQAAEAERIEASRMNAADQEFQALQKLQKAFTPQPFGGIQ